MPPKANEAIDSLIDIEQYTAAPFSTRAAGPDEGQRLADEALENSWVKFFLTTEFGNNPESVEALLDMWRLYGEKSNPNIVTKDELPPGVGASYNRQDIFSHYLLNKPDYMNLQEGDFYGFIDELAHGFQFSREPESQLMPTGKKLEDMILQDLAYGAVEPMLNPRMDEARTFHYPKLGFAGEEYNPQFTEQFISRQESPLSRAYYKLLAPFVQWHEYEPGITDEGILPFEFEAHKSIAPKLVEEFFNKYIEKINMMENSSPAEPPETIKQYLEMLMEQ